MGKRKVVTEEIIIDKIGEFTNSAGVVFKICGLPPLAIPQLQDGLVVPEKPKYTITTATGDKETYDHDETTLQTDEDKLAWAKYIEEVKAMQAELTNRMLTCILIEGVIVEDDIDLTRWESKQRLMGMKIPDDIEAKLLQYKRSAVIRSADDMKNLMDAVMALTGVSQEAIEKAKKSFQDKVQPKS
jgi:hypothetical protein